MNEPTSIYLIRHGETDWNVLRRFQGQSLVPLNPTGLRQAARVARRVTGERLTALYSSDLPRAMQTAQAIAAVTGLPIVADARLREVDVGQWQGHTFDEIEALDGARLAARRADRIHVRCPDGENQADLVARVEAAFNAIVAAHPGERIAIVTHGGPISAIRYVIRNRASEELLALDSYNTAVTLVRGAPGAWEIVMENDISHLEGAEVVPASYDR